MSTLFSGHYLRNRSTLDIGVLGYIGIVQHKEHSPEVFHIPPGTPCIFEWGVGGVDVEISMYQFPVALLSSANRYVQLNN